MAHKNWLVPVAVLLIVILFGCLIVSCNSKANTANSERFYDMPPDPSMLNSNAKDHSIAAQSQNPGLAGAGIGNYAPSDPDYGNEMYNPVTDSSSSAGGNCFPRDRLTSSDLLPKGAADSTWSQANPAGQGDINNVNFLAAGTHMGINTTGSSMKNASWDLRSEPIAPQRMVSPWNMSTIEPDLMRRSFEIGSGAA